MDRNMLLVVVSVLVSIIVLWIRHSGKKLKFPSWKKMVLVVILIMVVWYNWIDIKKGLNKFWVERMAENVSFLNQKSKTGIAQEKLRDLEEKARERPLTSEEVASLEETRKEMGVTPSPTQRQPGTVLSEVIKEIPANKKLDTEVIVTPDQVEQGVSCLLTQQGEAQTYWFVNGSGPDIKINTCKHIINLNAWGNLELRGGKKPTTVKIQIIFTGKKVS